MTDSWQPTACILCECNCGIEVVLGGDDGRRFTRIRGDRRHPESRGYVCQKAGRLDLYQNSRDRLLRPLRRRADGGFEEIEWDTAIREVAARFLAVRDAWGGESIFYYGGGGQGNHLPAVYSGATRRVLGSIYRSSALAQEKTGEFWVHERMFESGPARGDFERCEVGVFLGKNPWQSHGIPRARLTLRELAKDPGRALVVIDARRSETADLADYFLQVRPGTDAWLLAAMLGVLVGEGLVKRDWVDRHTSGFERVLAELERIDVEAACAACGVDEDLVRVVTRRIAGARSVSVFEDLGVQMNRHSTLVSYLERLLWVLTGNFAIEGGHNVSTSLVPIAKGSSRGPRTTPVVGAPIIAGLTPCNTLAEEILTDHPQRYRAMLVEAANPAHSLADSPLLREALRALECLVVIDVALTETARLAHYVLPATTQYEKAETTFFSFGFPENVVHLRRPLLDPPEGPLPEPEIHARLVEAMGALPADAIERLRSALGRGGRPGFAREWAALTRERPDVARVAPVVLYRALGPGLPDGCSSAAALWGAAQTCASLYPASIRRAGIGADTGAAPGALGEALFDAIIASPTGLVFTHDPAEESWTRLGTPERRILLEIPELLDELRQVIAAAPPPRDAQFPFVLSAGERRSYTANTIYRDPEWRKQDASGALSIHPDDAARLGVGDGDRLRLVTRRGTADVVVEVSDRLQPGHVSLPNGLGVDYPDESGAARTLHGTAPNELTAAGDRDWLAGTPWHKSVPARLERLQPA